MRKLVSAAIATVLAGVMMIPAPASPQSFNPSYGQQDRFVSQRCLQNSNLRGCDDWRRNHNRWSKSDYQRWYRWNQPSVGNFAAGLFGFAVGAAIANGINRGNVGTYNSHVAACEARFRSYNAETDTYLGYDGNYHRCNL